MTLTHEQLSRVCAESLDAALRDDAEGIDAAVAPIFTEGTPTDGLLWVLWMAGLADNRPRPGDGTRLYQPRITTQDPTTGEIAEPSIDALPPGVAAYARIRAAWANNTPDLAAAVWEAMLKADRDGTHLEGCMSVALTEAVRTVQRWQ